MKKFQIENTVFVLLLAISINTCAQKTVLWDVGGILFKPDTSNIFRNVIGVTNPANYYITSLAQGVVPVSLRQQAYTILYEQFGYQECEENRKVRDNHGQELPHIMVEWLNGTQNGNEILQALQLHLNEREANGQCINKAHRLTLESIFKVMFDPQVLAEHMKPITAGYELLQASIKAGNKNIIISNFDPQSFEYLYSSEAGYVVFANLDKDNIIISGECNVSKPHEEIFDYAIQKFNLNPSECIFIDDQWENIVAGQKKGFGTLYVPNQNFDNAKNVIL